MVGSCQLWNLVTQEYNNQNMVCIHYIYLQWDCLWLSHYSWFNIFFRNSSCSFHFHRHSTHLTVSCGRHSLAKSKSTLSSKLRSNPQILHCGCANSSEWYTLVPFQHSLMGTTWLGVLGLTLPVVTTTILPLSEARWPRYSWRSLKAPALPLTLYISPRQLSFFP